LNCDQIQELLVDYQANELPGYKVNWVAQHLAGCRVCRTHKGRIQPELKHLQKAEEFSKESTAAQPVAPAPWLPAVGLMLTLGLALSMLIIQHRYDVEAGMVRPQRLRYQSTVLSQNGVTASVTELVRREDLVFGELKFHGQSLALPAGWEGWLRVVDDGGKVQAASVSEAIPSQDSFTVRFQVHLSPDAGGFRLYAGPIYVQLVEPWLVQLPRPTNGLDGGGVRLQGEPTGLRLIAYGLVGDMLVMHLRAPLASGQLMGTQLILFDASETQVGSALFEEIRGPNDHGFWIQYPVPRETHLPFRLVGQRISYKEVGPWEIPILMVP